MGLSPRVRGNHLPPTRLSIIERSIPACTGKPGKRAGTRSASEVYPRVYGETTSRSSPWLRPKGLSPRVRGNRGSRTHPAARLRSIPACTGKPTCVRRSEWQRPVYPRVYGETCAAQVRYAAGEGLSPRVRGNRWRGGLLCSAKRSIPACTGKPGTGGTVQIACEVYPRVYGETNDYLSTTLTTTGLSPRVRGNLLDSDSSRRNSGSIPACTGKPMSPRSFTSKMGVYPRVYGETHLMKGLTRFAAGLSPRVRGNQRGDLVDVVVFRSIPACTGKPNSTRLASGALTVYPRVYGETPLLTLAS